MTEFGVLAAALVATVTALLTAFWKVWTDRERLHVDEVKRISDECLSSVSRIKQDLIEARLYGSTIEAENGKLELKVDAWRTIAATLRDKCSLLQTTLAARNIPIPEEKRNVTKPLDAMMVEHLESQNKPKDKTP